MQLFYQPELDTNSTSVGFDKEESRHITRVLRKSTGDLIHITNGKGLMFQGELGLVEPKHCEAYITKVEKLPALPYRLHLAVAPTKSNDRFEWFLEKATEIGISRITPLLCDHSERKQINWERYHKILVSAMKQSLQAHLPELVELTSFSNFIDEQAALKGIKAIAHCEESSKTPLKTLLGEQESVDILVLIGPEGDFSPAEIEKAVTAGFEATSLGEQRLRTETAALVACHTAALIRS
ncbi:16S rRNA (uracil(1498)-N(3))-methyltransferase [Gilvibacter sp. SZ-19]|uniref:16S rRNA (uracil(1498)-N(3))-methyltransferase n=1 Tax=Gilvibacter sp. SZ-19 TaxID=754429 RepID=UPI000B3D3459|nr:16S rRNA (uracil(1498)-N(3))-methyltransferase [Gilvibacter sp. SZ-19]ARV13332.1 16S rRNA (uracil(1498)-N(3))-methyltransferase [Gilvibacter sp. SZ-19]